ncbi:MAG: hypothetical protein KDE09_05505 [Anaerolineales bacterium]|nr:hypothetical protein [Anaerolineales bacterium]
MSQRHFLRSGILSLLLLSLLVACGGETELTINWTVENEIDVVGYNLLRSDAPDGEFVQVNEAIIPPLADPFIGGEHEFVDRVGIRRGETYYYLLETIDRVGNASQEGPFPIEAR